MRGEASDFAAMRDAFRSAGLCSEATPAALVESWCARRDDASDGEDSLYVPSPQRVKIRRRLAEACVASPRFVRRAAEAAAVERLNRRRAVRALAAVVARGRAARLLARRADAFRAARGLSEWRKAAEAARRRAAADDLLDAYADARRTQRGLGRWRRGAARLRRRRRLRTHGRRAFHRWAKLIRYARRLRAARVFGVLKRAAQRRRRRELVVADAYRRARLRLVLGAWAPVTATWRAHRIAYAREALYARRLVEAVFARWVRVRRFRRAARDFLRARGLERRRTRQLARRCLRGWRARGHQALVLATPQQKHNRERSSRSLFSEDAIRRIHAPYT